MTQTSPEFFSSFLFQSPREQMLQKPLEGSLKACGNPEPHRSISTASQPRLLTCCLCACSWPRCCGTVDTTTNLGATYTYLAKQWQGLRGPTPTRREGLLWAKCYQKRHMRQEKLFTRERVHRCGEFHCYFKTIATGPSLQHPPPSSVSSHPRRGEGLPGKRRVTHCGLTALEAAGTCRHALVSAEVRPLLSFGPDALAR